MFVLLYQLVYITFTHCSVITVLKPISRTVRDYTSYTIYGNFINFSQKKNTYRNFMFSYQRRHILSKL